MPKIIVLNEQKKEIEVPTGTNLRTALRDAGVQVYPHIHKYLNCRGLGLCGSCAVMIKKGSEHVSKKSVMEKFTFATHPIKSLHVIGHEDEMRLACQCQVEGDGVVELEVRPAFSIGSDPFWSKPFPFNK